MHLPPFYTGITIGFERMFYTFSEERVVQNVQVFIIKQNNRTSELTYDITVENFPGSALNNLDFIATAEYDEVFIPTKQRIPVNFSILPDAVPEEIETFTFQLRNNDPDTTFTNNPRETTISITDTESECYNYYKSKVNSACQVSVLVLKAAVHESELCGEVGVQGLALT